MTCDIILAGVGGQGVLSVAAIIAEAAVKSGLQVRQSEVHGMSQRGGTVAAHLRIADRVIASDLISLGSADLLLGAEPLEAVRQLEYVATSGWVVSSTNRVEGEVEYPDEDAVLAALRGEAVPGDGVARTLLVDAEGLARASGSVRTAGVVMLGACAEILPIDAEVLRSAVARRFAGKGERIEEANGKAFDAGRRAFLSTMDARGVGHGD